jgi:capsid protein
MMVPGIMPWFLLTLNKGNNMALSAKAKRRIEVALARRAEALEVIAAIEAGSNPQATTIADITSSNLVGVDGTGSNAAPLAGTETRLDAIEAKINAILASLKAAGLMA